MGEIVNPKESMENIEQVEGRLWEAADQLRANSKLTSSEYSMPVLGLIFLRHAYNRFLVVEAEIKSSLPKRGGVTRPINKDDFSRKSALFLPEKSRYDFLLSLSADKDKGRAIIEAMEAIEETHENLAGVLPKDYHIFDNALLARLLKIFNDEALRQASGDVFGRIYEYFLMKFAIEGAQDKGEFFTPVSLVQTIVNVIEPDHGIVFDPACGSGGMFVQTSHFLEDTGRDVHKLVTFYGQEKTATTIKLAKMNLAVHGLEGKIAEGNTFYEDHHEMLRRADFVMANPPFNVDSVDAEKIKTDPRLPFGLPGVNKKDEVSNGNYLWISYFYSYLNATGRAGFVMSSQASSAGHGEKDVRRKLVESGHVDAVISIRSNFFYTRSVPCELWFFDKGKTEAMRDKTLMIDARNIYRKVTRKIYDFSPEQLKNLTAIVWLYRGKTEKFLALIRNYLDSVRAECALIPGKLDAFDKSIAAIREHVQAFLKSIEKKSEAEAEKLGQLREAVNELDEADRLYESDRAALIADLNSYRTDYGESLPTSNEDQREACRIFDPVAERIKGLIKQADMLYKLTMRAMEMAEKDFDAKNDEGWNGRAVGRLKRELDPLRKDAVEQLKQAVYFHRQIHWLQSRFPEAKFANVEGLVKLVDRSEIVANDWSLTPGRYVGVAPVEEEEDFDFEETLRGIHIELAGLNEEAAELAKTIQQNFEELGI
jgi:type I restriction enzyme M protein